MNAKKIVAALAIVTGLSAGGLEIEKSNQIANIHAKQGVNAEMVLATTIVSSSHRQNVETALIEEFENDGYVDYDNYELHQEIINKHFEELEEAGELPEWFSDISDLSEEQIISNIHNSLRNK